MKLNNYYAIRAIPGAGKHFLAALLWKHHYGNYDNIFHYSEKFNEYFSCNAAQYIKKSNGQYSLPFWKGSHWENINISKSKNQFEIITDHEWLDGLLKFKYQKSTEPTIRDYFEKKSQLIEGYYITTPTLEEIRYVYKLYLIKAMFGDRNSLMFDSKASNISDPKRFEYIRSITSTKRSSNYEQLAEVDYIKVMDYWKEFVLFLQNVPYSYPFSRFNMSFFYEFLFGKINLNEDEYLTYFEHFRLNFEKGNQSRFFNINGSADFKYYNPSDAEIKEQLMYEKNHLNKFKKEINNLYVINYRDLFLDYNTTHTVFDEFTNEIKEYTNRNNKLIKEIESFFGEV